MHLSRLPRNIYAKTMCSSNEGFPGGSAVKNQPANVGDMGS